jgi:aspartyl-tRNA(Asn)/glutamyl-tRNA(Gln) amidotransferase subunit C
MAQVSDVLALAPGLAGEDLRQDAVQESIDRKLVLAAAPESDGRFFKVPKVIER